MKNKILAYLIKFNIDGFITTMQDEHLNEFINQNENKIRFLTGFTGTAGTAFTSKYENLFLTDGRYHLQAKNELKNYKLVEDMETFLESIKNSKAKKIGIDNKFISIQKYEKLKDKLAKLNIELINTPDFVIQNLKVDNSNKFKDVIHLEDYEYEKEIDFKKIFEDCSVDKSKISKVNNKTCDDCSIDIPKIRKVNKNILSDGNKNLKNIISGELRTQKIKKIINLLKKDEILILTELDTIAWLFNIRGNDIENNLFFYSYSIIYKDKVILFTNADIKINNVKIMKYDTFYTFINKIPIDKYTILVSPNTPAFIVNKFDKIRISNKIREIQSIKSNMELYGILRSNILDAVALINLFSWINIGNHSEKEISEKLKLIKKNNDMFLTTSFDSIVAIDKNGAEMHHKSGNTVTTKNSIILIDSGSQYIYGTTDITRTITRSIARNIMNLPNEELVKQYTNVLKAVIAPKLLKNSTSFTGDLIDQTSRKMLILNYESSTGHGVGFGLNVHENPPKISYNGGPILKNQVFTIEPGVYIEGKYGIRIEDMVFLNENNKIEDLTFVPYQMNLIDIKMLSVEEKAYLNAKNKMTRCLLKNLIKDKNSEEYFLKNTEAIN